MFTTLAVAARDRKRLTEISSVVARFGLTAVLARLGLGGRVEDDASREPLPRRTRQALEKLGPSFVKLGQILSTRSDLLPPDWIAEFEQLQSGGRTIDFEKLRLEVEAALGCAPEDLFARFDVEPLAAASMAQVHRAQLKDGTEVVVKIRRPRIRPKVEADMRLLTELARKAEQSSAEVARYRPRALVAQLGEALLQELDFTVEGRNCDLFAADFARNDKVVIPRIHWEFTSESVLVQDYLEGIPPTDAERLRAGGVDPHQLARIGAEAVLDMVLVNGRFHADPHPGNLRGMSGDRVGLLDFGMIGTVTPRRRSELIGFVQALGAGDGARMAEVLADWTEGRDVSRRRLIEGAERLIARYGQGHVDLPAIVADLMGLMRKERVSAPPDLVRTMNGAWKRALFSRRSPEALKNWAISTLLDLSSVGDDLPRLIRAASRRLSEERAASDITGQREIARAVRRAGWLIAGAVVLAGLAVAVAIRWP